MPALYVLLGLAVGAILTTVVFVMRNDTGGATGIDPSRVETCIRKNAMAVTSVWPLGHEFEYGVSHHASGGAFRYTFAGEDYIAAFTDSESEATALADDVRGFAKMWTSPPPS